MNAAGCVRKGVCVPVCGAPPVDTPAPRAREREVGRSSPRPPRLGAVLSPAALSAALACPPASRRIKHQVARAAALGAKEPARPLPRELCNLHKAEDIHAGGRGPRARRLPCPFSRQRRQPRQPHGRPGPQRAPGLEWRRRQRVAAGGGGGPGEPAPGGGGCYPPPVASCVCIPEQDH